MASLLRLGIRGMGQLIKTLLVYLLSCTFGTIVFIALFQIDFLSSCMKVFFYKGLIYLAIASLASVASSFLFAKAVTVATDFKDRIAVFSLFFGITLGWFILIPVTTERSISVYMLSYIDSLDKPIGKEEFERIFFDDYILKHGSFTKRFAEQVETGSIEQKGTKYAMTERGHSIVKMFKIASSLFNTDDWIVNHNNKQ